MRYFSKLRHLALALGVLVGICTAPMALTSCSEVIDKSNLVVKSELTAADYISQNPEFSLAEALFKRVKLGNSDGASPIYSVLSARGNYTVFLPTNEAVQHHLDSLGVATLDELSAEELDAMAKSCIIDNGDNSAYETPDFPTSGAFPVSCLSDRLLSCNMDDNADFIINGTSRVIKGDIEVSNGFIHVVDAVIFPSLNTLDEQIAQADNLKVFSYLLQRTTFCDSLHEYLDMSYERNDRPLTVHLGEFTYNYAQHRYVGYTAFVEPDDVYARTLGIAPQVDEEGNLTNGEEIIQRLQEQDDVQAAYGSSHLDDFTHPDNPVNRFVGYHLLYGRMAYNRMVFHYNETGYKYGDWKNPQMVNAPTNVWEFYTTMGRHHGLVKITQVGDAGFEHDMDHKIYLNRISTYANGPHDDYHETGVVPGYAGIPVNTDNGENDNNAINGYYHTINDLLVYTPGVRNEMYKRRIRMDIASTLPELATNNLRGDFKTAFDKGYLSRFVRVSSETQIGHSHAQGSGWLALWGDEFRVFGLYDFVYQLPPVPKDGTYELRMGISHGPIRGMAQIYFGENPDNLSPAGLPYDMRQTIGPDNTAITWIADVDDASVNAENDKTLRNQGYLKGPLYFTYSTGRADQPIRHMSGSYCHVRKIIITADMKADKTYYLRFKSALRKLDAELNLDYFEYASKAVYNDVLPEDYW